jgi:hypothetical protein
MIKETYRPMAPFHNAFYGLSGGVESDCRVLGDHHTSGSPGLGHSVATRIADPALGLHAPPLVDIEVAQVLRRYVREGELDRDTAVAALEDLSALLTSRCWIAYGHCART